MNQLKKFNRNINHIDGDRHSDIETSLLIYKEIYSSNLN